MSPAAQAAGNEFGERDGVSSPDPLTPNRGSDRIPMRRLMTVDSVVMP